MGKKRISQTVGQAALQNLPAQLATAVRFQLQEIEARFPGGTVELRVPPFGAVQCIAGMEHRRGTPPNVVEIEPELFLALTTGEKSFEEVSTQHQVKLSGVRAEEVAAVFPLVNNRLRT